MFFSYCIIFRYIQNRSIFFTIPLATMTSLYKKPFFYFRYEDKTLVPIRVSKKSGYNFEIDLLLLEDGVTHHYVLITNLKNLISNISGRCGSTRERLCRNCFHICSTQEVLDRHLPGCIENDAAIIELPSKEKNKMEFGNYKARWFAPVVIYFDLESIIQPIARCCQQKQTTEQKLLNYTKHVGSVSLE